jgi:putative heme-binding domain-containing protein
LTTGIFVKKPTLINEKSARGTRVGVQTQVRLASLPAIFRALDFQDKTLVAEALLKELESIDLAEIRAVDREIVVSESLQRLTPEMLLESQVAKNVLIETLSDSSGTSEQVRLVRRFSITDMYPELLSLAQSKASEQIGVEAITALLELQQWELLMSALQGDDTAKAIATAEVMGNSGSGAINGPLLSVVKNADVNIDVRRACVKAASRVNNGATELVKLVDEKTLDPELEQSVAAALHTAPSRQAREAAQRLFPLPVSKDNAPTPSIRELTELKGDLANGRMVFFSTGTCHKCHVVDGMGREIGPNLSEIGSKLSREAMFESVLYPSAGISHNYEAWTAVMNDGTTLNGLLVSQTDGEVAIKGDDGLVRTLKKPDMEELVKQKISLMPADLQKTMTTQELADVVEYMQSLKKK